MFLCWTRVLEIVYIAAPEKLGNILKTNSPATSLSPSHLLILLNRDQLKNWKISQLHTHIRSCLAFKCCSTTEKTCRTVFFILSTDESDQRHCLEISREREYFMVLCILFCHFRCMHYIDLGDWISTSNFVANCCQFLCGLPSQLFSLVNHHQSH